MKDFRAEGGEVKTQSELRMMGEKKRFKRERGEFNNRPRTVERDDDYDPKYELLKRRHLEFMKNQGALENRRKREAGDEADAPTRERKSFDKERKSFKREGGGKSFGKGGKSFDRKPADKNRADCKPFGRKFGQK